jgi:SAM-dependent methyltransferase
MIEPNRQESLANIRISPEIKQPLGGLNPYSKHFTIIGEQFHKILIEHAGLNKNSNILDIGCGTGRIANQLHGYQDIQYNGFDVNQHFIDYCNETYRQRNFKFNLIDIQHDEYNPGGAITPENFKFPYKSGVFDLVISIAVFNHFRLKWVQRYIAETSRVLKNRGICLCTMFLLNNQSIDYISNRTKPPCHFNYHTTESWHDFESRPLFNVAHHEEAIRQSFIKYELTIKEPIRYGQWCGSKIALSGPDVLIARKGGWAKQK